MKLQTFWQSARRPTFAKISKSGSFDVVVIGGGLTGVSTAYLAKRAGLRVCLLERDRLGFVDTGLTTAHLTYVTDARLTNLVKTFGEEGAALAWDAGATAISTIEEIVERESIDCEFRRVPGYLHAALHGKKNEEDALEEEAELAKRLGFPVRFTSEVPYFSRPGIHFPDQAKFHPLKYLFGLAAAIHGDGSVVHEQSGVDEVQDSPSCATVGRHKIEAGYIVIATHVPLIGKASLFDATFLQTKIYPYSSYVIGAKVPRKMLADASFWDTSDPYFYLRVEPGKSSDYAIFGGADHKTGQSKNTQECFDYVTSTLLDLIPQAKPDRQWSGQVIETNDGLPYIGETAPQQFAATGFSGNGMTFGTVAAMMARDAAQGKPNPWQKLFAIGRKKVRGGTWDYLVENLDYPFYYLKDRLSPAETKTTRQVKRGEGAIIKLDGERVACSRDDNGKLHSLSPYCTHMGCLVRWNGAEHTWDCPCHGSRFHPDGKVLAGPAETDLEKVSKQRAPKQKAKAAKRK